MPLLALVLRDPVSAATHLFWSLWAAYAGLILWNLAHGDRVKRWSVAVFACSMVLLYGLSGLYHALTLPREQLRFFQLLDHSAIYVLIAGTYTPPVAILLRGRARAAMLGIAWGIAALGIAAKWALPMPPYMLTVGLYVLQGWIGILIIVPLVRTVGAHGMGLAVLGGAFYTAGGIVDAVRWPVLIPGYVGPHEVFHVCAMTGTFLHVDFVTRFILPYEPPYPEMEEGDREPVSE